MEQLEHMTEVVFVSQSVTANYHSFHSSSQLDKHLAEITHRTYLCAEFKTHLSLGKHSYFTHRLKEGTRWGMRIAINTAMNRVQRRQRTLGKKTRGEADSYGTGRGGRGVTTNSPWDKYLEPRTKERRRKTNEKERETASTDQPDVESVNQILQKYRREVRQKRRIWLHLASLYI